MTTMMMLLRERDSEHKSNSSIDVDVDENKGDGMAETVQTHKTLTHTHAATSYIVYEHTIAHSHRKHTCVKKTKELQWYGCSRNGYNSKNQHYQNGRQKKKHNKT